MTDIETRVTESLRADADRVPPPIGLAGRAMGRAAVIRRRRRVAGATAAAALLVAGAFALPRTPVTPAPPVATASRPVLATTLPGSTELSAAQDPAAVGTDPGVLHFDVDHAALGAVIASWSSAPGVEGFVAESGAGQPRTEVYLGTDATRTDRARLAPLTFRTPQDAPGLKPGRIDRVTVGDRPATLERQEAVAGLEAVWVLRWEPVAGLFAVAQTWGDDRAAALAVPAALRLDRSQRCVTPLRLAALPDGFRQSACRTSTRAGAKQTWVRSQIEGAGGVSVWAEEAQPTGFEPNTTVGGDRAQWRTEDPPGLWFADLDGAQVMIQGLSETESGRVAVGLSLAPDLSRPSTWR